jgi:adenine-specific DNA-methyltransferase
MPDLKKFEKRFFSALGDIFIGAKVEGDSGFINLMSIKRRYYEKGVFPQLQKDIDLALQPFPDFREELFDKLYTFFQRYFSESGSIYFCYTALHQNVYEKVYTDDRDVILFWKTHMLYYVKTDRIFTSLAVEVEGERFFFDASGMTLKKANEKRQTIYEFRKVDPDGTIVFDVAYSEKGRTTRLDDILKMLKLAGRALGDEVLTKACRVFEKQSEVDYFINKNARAFLQEQFELWLYQYLFAGQNVWSSERLAQLQALKGVAFKVIDFISQFEDELVKIWNKPKFVLNAHYILTLDKVAGQELLDKLLAHPGMSAQLEEWRSLGMLDDAFRLEMLREKDLLGAPLHPHFQFLPLDTRCFPDLELELLQAITDAPGSPGLDAALDGWLVHSENYQAINSFLSKFQGKVKAIYIDPPYNTDASEINYVNKYKDASWLTLIENRISRSKLLLSLDGFLCATIDDFELNVLHSLLNLIFTEDHFVGTIAIRNNPAGRSTAKGFSISHEYALFVSRSLDAEIGRLERTEKQISRYDEEDNISSFEWVNFRKHGGANARRIARPKLFYPIFISNKSLRIPAMTWNENLGEWELNDTPNQDERKILPIAIDGEERTWKWGHETAKNNLNDLSVRVDQQGELGIYMKSRLNDEGLLPTTFWDKSKYSASDYGTNLLTNLFGKGQTFSFPKSVHAVEDCIKVVAVQNTDLVLDFFAGSGTTAHAVMNLNRADGGRRKYILVEMGEHFNTVILPRIKKVAFCSKWKDGKPSFEKGESGMSHFAKYYELEQYEDVLRRARYADADLFDNPYEDPYHRYLFLRDLKLLDALEVDPAADRVHFHPERLYPGIDLAETLSNLTGKWIRRITAESVEFEDGSQISLSDPDWRLLKPLVWWQ